MADRLSMVLELDAPEEPLPEGSSHAQGIAALRRASQAAKGRVLPRIEALRRLDPGLEIGLRGSLFPVLIVRGTPEVIEKVRRLPGVLRLSPERDAELFAAG